MSEPLEPQLPLTARRWTFVLTALVCAALAAAGYLLTHRPPAWAPPDAFTTARERSEPMLDGRDAFDTIVTAAPCTAIDLAAEPTPVRWTADACERRYAMIATLEHSVLGMVWTERSVDGHLELRVTERWDAELGAALGPRAVMASALAPIELEIEAQGVREIDGPTWSWAAESMVAPGLAVFYPPTLLTPLALAEPAPSVALTLAPLAASIATERARGSEATAALLERIAAAPMRAMLDPGFAGEYTWSSGPPARCSRDGQPVIRFAATMRTAAQDERAPELRGGSRIAMLTSGHLLYASVGLSMPAGHVIAEARLLESSCGEPVLAPFVTTAEDRAAAAYGDLVDALRAGDDAHAQALIAPELGDDAVTRLRAFLAEHGPNALGDVGAVGPWLRARADGRGEIGLAWPASERVGEATVSFMAAAWVRERDGHAQILGVTATRTTGEWNHDLLEVLP